MRLLLDMIVVVSSQRNIVPLITKPHMSDFYIASF